MMLDDIELSEYLIALYSNPDRVEQKLARGGITMAQSLRKLEVITKA